MAPSLKRLSPPPFFRLEKFFFAIVASIKWGSKMGSLQRRIAAVTDTTANLIAQLRELDRLREQVRKALLSARKSQQPNRRNGSGAPPRSHWKSTDREPALGRRGPPESAAAPH